MGVFNLLLCNASVTRFLFLLSSYYYYYYNGLRDVFQRHPYACKQASQPAAHFKALHKALQNASSDTVF
jgi:hypothetical protein